VDAGDDVLAVGDDRRVGAELAGELGARAFYGAFDRWTSSTDPQTLAEIARELFSELKTAMSTLT